VNVKIITDVTTEPITTAEAKSHLRVDITDDNDYIDSIVIPKPIKQAMLLLIGHWYENREATAFNVNRELAFSVNALLYPYKVLGW
jgi:hypothetical protein